MLRPWWQSPWSLGGGGLVAVVVVVLIIVLVVGAGGSGGVFTPQPVPATVLSAVTGTGASVIDQVGSGGTAVGINPGDPPGEMIRIAGSTTLAPGGKPELVYVGGEFCPYCAAERWAIVDALERFGSFSGLQEMVSSPSDVYPSTHTFTFVKAHYTSAYITFDPNEIYSNVPDPSTGYYKPLQTPSAKVSALFAEYGKAPYQNDSPSRPESFPFLDIANRFDIYSVQYSPQVLRGLTWSQIATDLSNPRSPVAQAIVGSANYLTAAICITTGNQPSSACSPRAIQSLESTLNGLKATG